ncbi:hypothetical protein QJQ59_05945 (plasmid) [Klebsiella michiganensis]|nr:hypothetical protein QJQ59_05945 [Klebsiella michiganensis]
MFEVTEIIDLSSEKNQARSGFTYQLQAQTGIDAAKPKDQFSKTAVIA